MTLLRVLLMLLVVLGFIAHAQESDTTRRLEQDIEAYERLLEERRQEQARLEAEITETAALLNARIAERDRVSQNLFELQEERAAIQAELVSVNERLEETRAQIETLNARLGVLRERLQGLLVNLYKQRSSRYARVLSQAESFHELRVKNYYLSLLTAQDVALVDELNATVARLSEAQATLSAQIAELQATEAELQANEVRLEATRGELDALITELQATREGQSALRLAAIETQEDLSNTIAGTRSQLEREVTRLRDEAERARERAEAAVEARERERLQRQVDNLRQRADNLQETAAPPRPTAPPEDGFAHPFPNPQLTTAYNEEGTYVALRAESPGAAVRAVMSGVVQGAQFFQANTGYIVIIAHGSDLLTVYQNLQRPTVEVGDSVSQGDIIGYLGGGTLPPDDTLYFYVGIPQGGGAPRWIDPAPRLGFN